MRRSGPRVRRSSGWWDGLTFGPQYRALGPGTLVPDHRTPHSRPIGPQVSHHRVHASITSGSTRPVCRRGLDENDHDDCNLSAGGDCSPIGDRASTVRRGDGAGCDGPVRGSEGPSVLATHLRLSHLRTAPSHHRPLAPSDRGAVQTAVDTPDAHVAAARIILSNHTDPMFRGSVAPSPPRSVGPRAVQNAARRYSRPPGAGPPRPPRPPPPNDGYGFGFTISRSRKRSIDWAITSIASNAALSKA